MSLEQEIKDYFKNNRIVYGDNCGSTTMPDFNYQFGDEDFFIDAKEKLKPYKMANWTDKLKEEDCFIADELGIRKILFFMPTSAIVIKNNILNNYVLFTCLDLFCVPKIRMNRKLSNESEVLKGKWLINFKHGFTANRLEEIFDKIHAWKKNQKKYFFEMTECYGNYADENVGSGGVLRNNFYRANDYSKTR